MNKYYVRGCKHHGGMLSYTAHDYKIARLKKSRRKTSTASKRANRA